jgi:hypothetical protein
VGLHPAQQSAVSVSRGREAFGCQEPADVVEHGGDMDVLVGVDPARHMARLVLRDGCHRHSFFVVIG